MNPYLEQPSVWRDFHSRFLPLAAEDLASQVDPRYYVKIEENLFVHEASAEQRRLAGAADIALTQGLATETARNGAALLEAPVEVSVPDIHLERGSYLEICDRDERRVVTVLELLSPSNKYAGPDRDQYIAKRNRVLGNSTHLVEIDLLRGGPRLPLTDLPPCDYYTLVSRIERRPRAELWPVLLRQRLPVIPVPLSDPQPDAQLDLQDLLHRIYDVARYRRYIYGTAPTPHLTAEDIVWAQTLLPAGK
jgi:hypothetical protein